jgi:hypothetical protein
MVPQTGDGGQERRADVSAGLAIEVCDFLFEAVVETRAVSDGELEDAFIGSEDEDVAGGIENSGADFAVLEVLLDHGAHFGGESVVEKAGDVIPDVFAVD